MMSLQRHIVAIVCLMLVLMPVQMVKAHQASGLATTMANMMPVAADMDDSGSGMDWVQAGATDQAPAPMQGCQGHGGHSCVFCASCVHILPGTKLSLPAIASLPHIEIPLQIPLGMALTPLHRPPILPLV